MRKTSWFIGRVFIFLVILYFCMFKIHVRCSVSILFFYQYIFCKIIGQFLYFILYCYLFISDIGINKVYNIKCWIQFYIFYFILILWPWILFDFIHCLLNLLKVKMKANNNCYSLCTGKYFCYKILKNIPGRFDRLWTSYIYYFLFTF